MRVKIFEAPDMASGLKMVRKELGPDALILSTRTVKDGPLGLHGREYLEITAAIDNDYATSLPRGKQQVATGQALRAYSAYNAYQNATEPERRAEETPLQQAHASSTGEMHDEKLRLEINQLKEMVESLSGRIAGIQQEQMPAAENTATAPLQHLESRLYASRKGNDVEHLLLTCGINQDSARVIAGFAADQLDDRQLFDPTSLYPFLHATLADILQVAPMRFVHEGGQQRIALIGPTGVGKTTTLAKLAARYLSGNSRSLALITIDTYRIAAVEQLKIYAEIMHLPLEVVITPDQLEKALAKHNDKECILIDTAGRSHLDNNAIEELHSFLDPRLSIENHLVISATTRDDEITQIRERFSRLGISSILFTKTDECCKLGSLLNVQVKNGDPISYITNGQRVPEDIIEAQAADLARRIVPSSMETSS